MADHYSDGTYRWWHLSQPSPELLSALADGWLPAQGRVADIGCGLGTEAAHLAALGWEAFGIDLSEAALSRAASEHDRTSFLRADLRHLPFPAGCLDAAVDRGCFHYLPAPDRVRYASEVRRVLRLGGKLLLRASLRAEGVRNDIDETVITDAFAHWRIDHMERAFVPTDTRTLRVLVVRLTTVL